MQAWNQWGAQASGGTTYAGLSGFTTPTVATVPSPAVAAGTPPVAPLQGYPLGGYQWPNYPASAVGTYAGAQWPLGQQTQHWDHWQQWQQQYNQWQQQYGDKLGASGAGLVSQPASSVEGQASIPTSQPSIPMQVTNIQTVSSSKRLNDGSGDGSQQEIKKLCMDGTQNSEWSAQKASANKDNLEELSEAEKLFDEQFRNWERQFNAWREQNANHPDTEQYKAYEAKWKNWQAQLLQRREQMRKKREAKLAEAAKVTEKNSSSMTVTSSTIPVSTVQHSNLTTTTATTQQSSIGPANYTAATVGMYGQVGFPGYGFGQQNYLFGISPGNPTAGFPATSPLFPGVAPPVMATTSIASSDKTTGKQGDNLKNVSGASTGACSESTDQSEFIKTSSGSGIPGLDLLNQPGSGKQNIIGETPAALLPQSHLPIQTPADSKPFDFPPPNCNTQNKFPSHGMMPQLNMPPPGFPSMSGYGTPSKLGAYSQPPPNFCQEENSYNDNTRRNNIPRLMDYDSGRQLQGNNLNENTDWPCDRNSDTEQRFGSEQTAQFGNRYKGMGADNNYGNSFERLLNREGNYQNRQLNSYGDEKRQSWQLNSFKFSNNKGYNFQGRNDYSNADIFNEDRMPKNSDATGPENEEAEYERFHEYQQGGLNQTDRFNSNDNRSNNREESSRGPRVSRFSDREDYPFKGNTEGSYEKFNAPHFSNRMPADEARKNLPNLEPEEYGIHNSRRFGRPDGQRWKDSDQYYFPNNSRWENDGRANNYDGSASKEEYPPVLEPVAIIDYRHQPADLGVPDIHEPASLIDYAHGAHTLPPEDEERFTQGSKTFQSRDHWNTNLRDHGRGGGNFERVMSPNRHWNDSRDKDYSYENRTRWGSPVSRGRDDKRWEGNSRDDFRKDVRSRDNSRNKDESRGREDRWRDRRHDSNDRVRQSNRDNDRRDRDKNHDGKKSPGKLKSLSPKPLPEPQRELTEDQKQVVVLADDILSLPGRAMRPAKIVILLRGPPGSGKTFVAKLIKDKEVEVGGSAPRILSLDDYFMAEVEKEETDNETGRKVTKKIMEYEFEAAMEPHYRDSLVKAFRKTVTDGYFPFIIVDCINNKVAHFEEIASFAKTKGFQVYVCEMDMDASGCFKRNIHKRTESEIEEIIKNWEKTPPTYIALDIRSLLQDVAIPEVDMEDSANAPVTTSEGNEDKGTDVPCDKTEDDVKNSDEKKQEDEKNDEDQQESGLMGTAFSSKWDSLDSTYDKLDRLDGLAKARRPRPTITDWLQLPEDYFETTPEIPGKKQVRWADLEERRQQEKMRAIGFVVGQTDWSRMLDPSGGQSKLTQTKYI